VATEDETTFLRGHPVERLIFGGGDGAEIDAVVSKFAEARLGSPVKAVLFRRTSVGVVTGVELLDRRRVVIKAHQPQQPIEVLTTFFVTQRYLADQGFPCPRPVIPPAPIGKGLATAEEFRDEGSFADPHDPAIRAALAEALVRLVGLTRPLGAPTSLRHTWSLWSSDELWPATAHSPIFDLARTSPGAEWIDELAREARALLRTDGPAFLVHSDWSGKHFRFDERGEITVVYDWDSLALRTEVQALGIAAGTFTSNFELDLFYAPAPEEVTGFIGAYSRAREVPLNEEETIDAHAAAYVIAYTARCEHALGQRGDFTEGLARFGRAYLEPAR
jgi:Phosphotransferase enzyme family